MPRILLLFQEDTGASLRELSTQLARPWPILFHQQHEGSLIGLGLVFQPLWMNHRPTSQYPEISPSQSAP